MRPLPNMIKKVAAILDEPADDVNELARAVVNKVYELWSSRATTLWWCLNRAGWCMRGARMPR